MFIETYLPFCGYKKYQYKIQDGTFITPVFTFAKICVPEIVNTIFGEQLVIELCDTTLNVAEIGDRWFLLDEKLKTKLKPADGTRRLNRKLFKVTDVIRTATSKGWEFQPFIVEQQWLLLLPINKNIIPPYVKPNLFDDTFIRLSYLFDTFIYTKLRKVSGSDVAKRTKNY